MNKSFTIFSDSYWHRGGQTLPDGAVDEVMVASVLSEETEEHDDDVRNQFFIRWYDLGGQSVARLEIYEDAWHYLDVWGDLFKELAQLAGTNPSPAELAAWLKERGFDDVTPRQEPMLRP